MNHSYRRVAGMLTLGMAVAAPVFASRSVRADGAKAWLNPVTRYIHVSYAVPFSAPEEIRVICAWTSHGRNNWRPAGVTPLISDTGRRLVPHSVRAEWVSGRVTEMRAAGLRRTVIFNPYPDAQHDGRVDADFRIEMETPKGDKIASETIRLQADNTDVVCITDFSKVLQKDAVSTTPADGKWFITKDMSGVGCITCKAGAASPALTYPLNLNGPYAIFIGTNAESGPIMLRLSGDERTERVTSSKYEREVFWRWRKMDWEHLVIKQRHDFSGFIGSSLGYVRLVPLTKKMVSGLNAPFTGKHDKFVTAYFEPYSWAFNEDVRENYQHRGPISAYAETGIDLMDVQATRFGSKSVYESRKIDQLLYATMGDPINGVVPTTSNVGKMQQYTNMVQSEMKYAREMGLNMNVNFGATDFSPDSPVECEFSKAHPTWRRETCLLLSVPEVRDYMLSAYREVLAMGASGISIDFCRYPDGVDSTDDCNMLMRGMRRLADEFGKARGTHVPIVVRFPSQGTRKWEFFDYKTWAREGLVDYICPSNLHGVYQFIDIKPYVDAVQGTSSKLTPEIDAIEWGPIPPGQLLWWAKHLYDAGASGVYIYQADGAINSREARQCLSLLTSSKGIERWLKKEAEDRPHCSKGIYITPPQTGRGYGYWERIRIWTEGINPGVVETYLDGRLIGKPKSPPYLVGTDGFDSNKVIPLGEHILLIRAKDGDGWVEQTFKIKGEE